MLSCQFAGHICSIMVSVSVIVFEAGASDFISHTIDLNTCCMYRDIQVVLRESGLEAQVYITE